MWKVNSCMDIEEKVLEYIQSEVAVFQSKANLSRISHNAFLQWLSMDELINVTSELQRYEWICACPLFPPKTFAQIWQDGQSKSIKLYRLQLRHRSGWFLYPRMNSVSDDVRSEPVSEPWRHFFPFPLLSCQLQPCETNCV